jgi:hypothetical protein
MKFVIPESVTEVGYAAFNGFENYQTIQLEGRYGSWSLPDSWDPYWNMGSNATYEWESWE